MKRTYILKGTPCSWVRPGRRAHIIYDSQKQIKRDWGIMLDNQHNGDPLFEGPLQLDIGFYFPIPVSRMKRKNLLLETPHFYRPDLSNLIKLVEDVCTGIIYHDDCLIASINAIKRYDMDPRTEFTITKL